MGPAELRSVVRAMSSPGARTSRRQRHKVSSDSWVIELDPMNQKGRENRELYAHAGLALSLAQNLEHVLKNFIVLAAAIERRRSQPASTADDQARFNADLEKLEAETFKQTLGRLINLVKSRFQFQAKPGREATSAKA